MLSHGTRNSELKRAILREIYVDNLKFAGRPAEAVASPKPNKPYIHFLRLILVVCALGISSFAHQAPLEHTHENVTKNVPKEKMTVAQSDKYPPVSTALMDIDLGIKPLPVPPAPLLHHAQYLNWPEPVDPHLDDFNLLLSTNTSVRLSTLFGLGVKTIVIDPGHGGKDPGAIGDTGVQEKTITLDVAMKLKARLEGLNAFKVLLTRDRDQTLSLAQRVDYAKANAADIFISVHVNSLPQKRVNLIETYYFGPPLTIQALRLAEQENKASNFSVGELDAIIKDIGNALKRQESARLAAGIQDRLFANMKDEDAQILNSGIKMAPFVVLSQIEIPSVLVEISCLSNTEEEAKLALSSYREKVASYIEEGIVSYLKTQTFEIAKGEYEDE